ncbi:MAG: hypothetical protein RIQ56_343 [Candidatus Parcubacteria bacterium]|jgi:type I restriction enzyme R subunit
MRCTVRAPGGGDEGGEDEPPKPVRATSRKSTIFSHYDDPQLQTFIDFVLGEYVKEGVAELDQAKLTPLLLLKYNDVNDAARALGGITKIRETFIGFQRYLYERVG